MTNRFRYALHFKRVLFFDDVHQLTLDFVLIFKQQHCAGVKNFHWKYIWVNKSPRFDRTWCLSFCLQRIFWLSLSPVCFSLHALPGVPVTNHQGWTLYKCQSENTNTNTDTNANTNAGVKIHLGWQITKVRLCTNAGVKIQRQIQIQIQMLVWKYTWGAYDKSTRLDSSVQTVCNHLSPMRSAHALV